MIIFKEYDRKSRLDNFNLELSKNSKDRFELRKSRNGKYYLYDYDYKEICRSKEEIRDILECLDLYNKFVKEIEKNES